MSRLTTHQSETFTTVCTAVEVMQPNKLEYKFPACDLHKSSGSDAGKKALKSK